MELESSREPLRGPWTTAVPWARGWHRPVRRSPVSKAASPPPVVRDSDWRAAVRHLETVRRACPVEDDDPWPAAVARHELHLALRQVRALAQQLDLTVGCLMLR